MKKHLIHKFSDRYGMAIIILSWFLTVIANLHFTGLFIELEAEKYIHEAQNLIDRKGLSATRFLFYSPTILIIYLSLKINAGFYGAFLIQASYNLLVTLFFFRSLSTYFTNSAYRLLTVFLLIVFLPYSLWTVYLYTESVFYSNILLLISLLLSHSADDRSKKKILILLALLLVIVSRPLGILFLLPTIFYFYKNARKKYKMIFVPVFLLALLSIGYISNIIFSSIEDVNITLAASQGCIVCGILPEHPPTLHLTTNGSQIYQLYYYVFNNFNQFTRIALLKVKYFFMMAREYYSTIHNIGLLMFIIPMYLLGIIYTVSRKQKKHSAFFVFQMSSILLFMLSIILQCDDYHNRFVLSLFPIFLLLAIKGLENLSVNNKDKN